MSAPGTEQTASAPLKRVQELLMSTYTRQPVTLVRGKGALVWDDAGREYIDLVAGIAVNVLGHAHPAMAATLAEQAQKLIHTSNLYVTGEQLACAEALIATAFPSRVFFCNSGTEANEVAIKLARKWGRQHRGGATTIITVEGAFHGRTLGSLAATASPRYREPFEPLPPGFRRVPYDDAELVEAAVDESVCAVLCEPIEGESGVVPMRDETLRALRAICDRHDLLLILDEVQTGMGRTGRWWAHQHAGITPDVMTVAKGLGGGFPIGAVLAAPRADVLEPGDHGCTFGGSPLACATALTVLRTVTELGLVDRAAAAGERLVQGLQQLADAGAPIAAVRGRGLMLAAVLGEPVAARAVRAGLETGVLVNATGAEVLRMVPPLVIDDAQIDSALQRLREALETVRTEGGA